MIQRKTTAYNDGVVKICAVENVTPPGGKPTEGLVSKCRLRYEARTLGMGRFYAALQNQVELSAVIRCSRREAVSAHDVAVIGGRQYDINLIQYPAGVAPPVMDLTLKELDHKYGFEQDQRSPADGDG